jgi:homoserine O-acetyltransferase/O-succinyltransferase
MYRIATGSIAAYGAALAFSLLSAPAGAHWPDQAPHQVAHLGEFKFEGGGSISDLKMTYVTHGKLSAAKDNAILFMHGFGLNHHQADHLIGPGKALDTDKYFVICTDELGNTQTTFEHSTSPTNSGLKMKFPAYNTRDKINAEYRLVTQALKIPHLLAVTGISSGAISTVQFAVSYPDFMDGIFPIVAGATFPTQASFFGPLMVSILESCAGWNDGNYERNPKECAANALSVFIPYFYTPDWWDQYVDTPEAYTNWRSQWGDYYLDIQEARDLYYRLMAGGRGWLGDSPGFNGDLNAALSSIKAKTLFLISPVDQFFPPEQIERQAKSIPNGGVVRIESTAGHLIAANADPNATRRLSDAIREFLRELSVRDKPGDRRN